MTITCTERCLCIMELNVIGIMKNWSGIAIIGIGIELP